MLEKNYSKYKWEILIVASILLFIVSYGLVFGSIIINDDSLPRIYYGRSYTKGLGRPLGTFLTNTIAYGNNNPIFTSIITWMTLLVSSIYTIKIFDIKRMRTMFAVTAAYYTFPIFGVYWRFGTDMWLYTLTCAMSIYGMYLLLKENKKVYPILLIIGSLAIYQAEIGIITMIFSIYFIEQIFRKKFDINHLLYVFGIIVISMVIYFAMISIAGSLISTDLSSYKSADSIGFRSIISDFIPNMINSYYVYFVYIIGKLTYFDYFHIPIFWLLFNLIPLIYFLEKVIITKFNSKLEFIVLLILIFTLPVSMNSQQMITSDFMTRSMFGNLILTIYIVVILLERLKFNGKGAIAIVVIALSMNLNSLNSIELASLSLQEENTKIGNQILLDLRSFPGYGTNSEVAICGRLSENDNYNFPRVYPYVFNHETFTEMDGVTYNFFMTYDNENEYGIRLSTQLFMYLGESVNIVYNQCNDSKPSFPEEGYMYLDNDIITINMGSN